MVSATEIENKLNGKWADMGLMKKLKYACEFVSSIDLFFWVKDIFQGENEYKGNWDYVIFPRESQKHRHSKYELRRQEKLI